MNTLLTTTDLTAGVADVIACRGLNLRLLTGECWAILGGNGVGKTTLLHTLAGLRPPRDGSIRLRGSELRRIPRRDVATQIGVVFQDSDDRFPGDALETVLIGRHPHLGSWQWESDADRALARAALIEVGLDGCAERSVTTLSGGERRRLAIATVLIQDPALYLLDEPTNHLDVHHQIAVLDVIARRTTERHKAAMMALHDANLAARFCTHVLLLYGDGAHDAGPASAVLTAANLARVYRHPIHRLRGPAGDVFVPG